MIKKFMLLGAVVLSLTTNAQDSKRGFYLKAGGSYFIQTVPTNFPVVNGYAPVSESNVNGVKTTRLISGSFGEGFRTNLTGGFRFTERLGVEMGVHYYQSNAKTMFERETIVGPAYYNLSGKGTVRALDLSPSLVLYLGEVNKFEPYTKVGVIVPVYGHLTIETKGVGNIPNNPQINRTDVVKPQPTLGFMATVGTSYKITNNLSAFAEVEYRNFTVKGKNKEVTVFDVNGVNVLPSLPYSETHSNYVDTLDASSNTGTNTSIAKDELASYVSISGVGLSLGMRYNF
ncbi:outer membrane beta-barrel protein [Flavobacterium oreochromis]|uniref:Outer membrane beta-barrel protein n=1 Tax=Flavobacterium oreochromis TaxID=2906078 RepID=A0ABW8P8B2_9FLAO|nr:outer membrane beta-barrel protein [Flavobacterium oreochromis]OWP78583.1 hypothetical protein BWG23_01640 [Flavobacterium oreochromis]QYS86988.1 outer membrane beta-barrel protein [Flavobacterium oreochromis]